jgi:DNA repair exonuclease SbcCD ATPase subunit
MTELQSQQHETLVASREMSSSIDGAGGVVGGSVSLGVGRRAERSVNVLATTNADLSRRVQSAVVGEANAMARLQRMEEEAREQGKRFAELVEIARSEEAAREEAEKVSKECQQKMKEAEDRVVRLLSRLHAETQNTTRLKKLLGEANAKLSEVSNDVYAGDAALSQAYEQTRAECQELRRQVGALRRENTMLVETVRDDAQERYAE